MRAVDACAGKACTASIDRSARGWPGLLVVAALGAALGLLMLAYLAGDPGWDIRANDFFREAWPAYRALGHGHLLQFVRDAPAYVGSLVLRSPFALIALALNGDASWTYAASALPCVAAATAFCAWLSAQPRRPGGIGWASRLSPLLLCFFSPALLIALTGGHPEDVLDGVLCVAGVVLAAKGQVKWSGVLIGLAVANKSWALVAAPATLAMMPAGLRLRGLAAMAVVAAAVLVPVTLVRDPSLSPVAAGAQLGSQTGTIFYSPQLLWWFGPHAWIVREAHPAIALLSVLCAAGWWRARRDPEPAPGPEHKREPVTDALVLLMLVLLLRAALDPWNNLYYHLPFLLALMAYEVFSGRIPRLTLMYTIVFAVVVPAVVGPINPGVRSAAYAAVVIPTLVWLAINAFAPGRTTTGRGAFGLMGVPAAPIQRHDPLG
ncbi:MAG: hypothetical protein ACLP22_21960 [Solirubrobacteraceae bacterium]